MQRQANPVMQRRHGPVRCVGRGAMPSLRATEERRMCTMAIAIATAICIIFVAVTIRVAAGALVVAIAIAN